MNHSDWPRIFRFGVSGLLATGMHVGAAVLLTTGVQLSQTLANSVAFVFATCGSYLLQTLWTFSSSLHRKNILRFLAVSLGGVAISGLVSHFAQNAGAAPWIGIAMVMSVVPPYTFVAHRFWTYR